MAQDDRDPSFSFGFQKVSAREKVDLVHHHFDSIAACYDRMNTLLSFGMHHLWKRAAVRMAGVGPGSLVLDVCGGTADLALLGAKRAGEKGRLIVWDMNRAMMEVGKRKAEAAGAGGNILFIEGDAEHLAFPGGTFDVAMVAFGIRNLVHPVVGLEEMYRVLKKGGTLICLEFSRDVSWWFKPLYDFYSFAIMPLLGKIFAGSQNAYTYLPESIRVFATPGELANALRTIGFQDVTYRKLTQGIAVIHGAVKS
jgi:demethylmenaquinone methyltransferase / 2-methoxy-6-polyprenyl-1,4-benzoquinol methylase